jgi:hypothetical protein
MAPWMARRHYHSDECLWSAQLWADVADEALVYLLFLVTFFCLFMWLGCEADGLRGVDTWLVVSSSITTVSDSALLHIKLA